MDLPKNLFKAGLRAGVHQLGIWNSIGCNSVAELLAGAGYDWVLIDLEHGPMELVEVLPSLQAIAGYPGVSAVVRPPDNDPILIKRLLDFGAQTLLLPVIESAEAARAAVSAMRYGPRGIRGMAGMTRATRYGRVDDYATRAEDELCLVLQIETKAGLDALEDIAAVDGVDGLFIGPADLSASLGHPGDTAHPTVVAAIDDAMARAAKVGIPCGIMALDPGDAAKRIAGGSAMTAVGVDMVLLADAVRQLRGRF